MKGSYTIGLGGAEQAEDLDTSLNQHGTHVAGLICGKKIGVAPEAEMISGVALPQRRGRLEDLIRFLLWVQDQPEIRLINFSGGIDSIIFRSMPQAQEAKVVIAEVLSLGQLIITAAGNKGEDFHLFPANQKGVVAVGATTIENRIASFSGGAQLVMEDQTLYMVPSLVAPGDQIYSCVNDGYMAKSGTSMATPIVTGIAALLLEQQTRISIVELRNRLFELCHDLGFPEWRQGRGLITLDKMP